MWARPFLLLIPVTASAGQISLSALPTSGERWSDVVDQGYQTTFVNNFDYGSNAAAGDNIGASSVTVDFDTVGNSFSGTLTALNLKPNFAYQIKLDGGPATFSANENLGLAGRWWRETWDGDSWGSGTVLNIQPGSANADDYPNTPSDNDDQYFAEVDDYYDPPDNTQLLYRYTGFLVLGYFVTDASGGATVDFSTGNSYHVLWRDSDELTLTGERTPSSSDGPPITVALDENTSYTSDAYEQPSGPEQGNQPDYLTTTLGIFGEWERLPQNMITLPNDTYTVNFRLTEESFHTNDGNWASVMGGDLTFTIVPEPSSWLLTLATALLLATRRMRSRGNA